jgi:hypothetical protein
MELNLLKRMGVIKQLLKNRAAYIKTRLSGNRAILLRPAVV